MRRKQFKRTIAILLAAAMTLGAAPQTALKAEAATDITTEEYQELVGTYSIDDSIPIFSEYAASYPAVYPDKEYRIAADSYVRYEEAGVAVTPEILQDYENVPGGGASVVTTEEALVEYEVNIEESGYYDLSLIYYPIEGKSSSIQRAFFIDGKLPYGEMSLVELNRIWNNDVTEFTTDKKGVVVKAWEKDNQGFDVKPGTVEIPEWVESYLYDSNGYVTDPLSVYLEAGEHTLTIMSMREPMLLHEIILNNSEKVADYATVKAAWDANGAGNASKAVIRIEAENAVKTSSQMLYPRQDQSSPAVYPSSPKLLLNNTIGGDSWKEAGQWIEWEFEAPQSGYYNIATYCKQNFVRGIDVCRKIYIDGEVPFAEMNDYGFSYEQNWREEIIADEEGNPYCFYLEAGTHTIRMEVVLGDMAEIISTVQETVQKLNAIYRSVIYITGVAPDKYRDYQIEASLPGLEAQLIDAKASLTKAIDALEVTAGTNSDKLTVLRTMDDQLDELIEDQERFTEVISSYKVNVRACGNWITQVLGQPLQLDRINIYSVGDKPKVSNDNWFARLVYELQRLFFSFIIDYNQIGNVAEEGEESKVLTLWVGTGRDQANVIKALIDERFTPNTNISINVQLVDMNTLLRATLAGEGPDIAIQVANTNGIAGAVLNTGNDTPVNYGLRNAVLDLSGFDDFEEVTKRFAESAMVPFTFNGATYALPDTQTFPMMFYRKDILAEIGLEIPTTWDEVKVAMTVLSKNQMEFGMLPTEQIFAMLLFQNGGEYYSENGDRSMLDSDIAVNTFKDYCEYYTDYKLDKATSVEERFRTGECPIIISDYTTYNNLQVSAPDIAGLWDFTVVPGTVQEDGTISHATGSTGLADFIMADTEYPEEAWEFLKWWTDAETQTLYGREMESLMGASARVATANLEALGNLSWPIRDYKEIMAQHEYVVGIPQVPGGYYSWRNLNNAFYTVTTDSSSTGKDYVATPREELMDKVLYINAEINYKREEFDLPIVDTANGN
ncbi:MAG: extracellular solute-binding protein [Lachnospiraceae bacterium]|nr:extracellular solute-binding protein [Lachnospiraceae bacterium]